MKPPPFKKVAEAFRRAAELLDEAGPDAWRLTADWQLPLTAAQGPSGRGSVNRPTETTALGRPDPLSLQHALLRQAVDAGFDNANTITAIIVYATSAAKIENERAGIGWCDCGRYCEGTANDRLRLGKCPACEARDRRAKAKKDTAA